MITSMQNQRVKNVCALQGKARLRNEQGVFIVEGEKMFVEAPADSILEVYVCEPQKLHEKTQDKLKTLPFEEVTREVFEKMSDTKTPQGILCLVKQHIFQLSDVLQASNMKYRCSERPLYVVLEDIQDPGNLGTIMRTSEGAGVTAVIMSSKTVDIYNPKTIRATMGSIYRVPFLYTDNLHGTIEELKKQGVQVFAAHLAGMHMYDEEDYTVPSAFLIGNEGNGLTEETALFADHLIRIPMQGQLESLNAAVATALLIYESNRQIRAKRL